MMMIYHSVLKSFSSSGQGLFVLSAIIPHDKQKVPAQKCLHSENRLRTRAQGNHKAACRCPAGAPLKHDGNGGESRQLGFDEHQIGNIMTS